MWHALVALFGLPGRCDFIRYDCARGVATARRSPGEVEVLGHIVGRAGLACDPGKVSAVRAWHVPGSVAQVRQFVGFIGYYRRFIQNFAGLSEPLVALTRKGVTFAWTNEQQVAFDTLKACLLQAPILGFPTEEGRFVLDTDANLFAAGGVLNQLQDDREVIIVYASWSLAAVAMCTNFCYIFMGSVVHTAH